MTTATLVTQSMLDSAEMATNLKTDTYTLPDFVHTGFVGDEYACLVNTQNPIPNKTQIEGLSTNSSAYTFLWNGITRVFLPVTGIPESLKDKTNLKITRVLVKTSGFSLHLDEETVPDGITDSNLTQCSQWVGAVGAQYSVALLTGQELFDELYRNINKIASHEEPNKTILFNTFLSGMIQATVDPTDSSKVNVAPKKIEIAQDGTQSGNVVPQQMPYSAAYPDTYALEAKTNKTVPVKSGVVCETKDDTAGHLKVARIKFDTTATRNGTKVTLDNTTVTVEKPLIDSVPITGDKLVSQTIDLADGASRPVTGYGYIAAMLRVDVPEDLVQDIYWSDGSQGLKVGVVNGTQQIACQLTMAEA